MVLNNFFNRIGKTFIPDLQAKAATRQKAKYVREGEIKRTFWRKAEKSWRLRILKSVHFLTVDVFRIPRSSAGSRSF
jgi:hypothetical protein